MKYRGKYSLKSRLLETTTASANRRRNTGARSEQLGAEMTGGVVNTDDVHGADIKYADNRHGGKGLETKHYDGPIEINITHMDDQQLYDDIWANVKRIGARGAGEDPSKKHSVVVQAIEEAGSTVAEVQAKIVAGYKKKKGDAYLDTVTGKTVRFDDCTPGNFGSHGHGRQMAMKLHAP